VAKGVNLGEVCEPYYPLESRRTNEEGSVVMVFKVLVNGRVGETKIETSSGFVRLDEATARCLTEEGRFEPEKLGNEAHESWQRLKYTWRLRRDESDNVGLCTPPKAPTSIPDGKKASKEEMIAAQAVVKRYVAEIEERYLPCVDGEANPALAANATAEQKKAYLAKEKAKAERHNAAVDAESKVSALFNDQLKLWKAAQAAK